VEGTPLDQVEDLEPFDFIRTIAVARIVMPASHVRLSAGREEMNEQMQALVLYGRCQLHLLWRSFVDHG
jgi:biotin synthase